MRWFLFAAASSLLACGGSQSPTTSQAPPPGDMDEPVRRSSEAAAPSPPDDPEAEETGLDRAALHRVLDAGPGAFLARFEVKPAFRGKAFSGWELVAFAEPQSRLAASGLEPGDIVTEVNRHKLERPENLQKLWDELRAAPSIVVKGERRGEPFELRFEVMN